MKKFDVVVTRTVWNEFTVEAENEEQAREKAEDMAYNYSDWNKKEADYNIERCIKSLGYYK